MSLPYFTDLGLRTDLWEALFLKVSNDTLPKQRRCTDNMEHLVIIVT